MPSTSENGQPPDKSAGHRPTVLQNTSSLWQRGVRKAISSFKETRDTDLQDDLNGKLEQALDNEDRDAVYKLIQNQHINLDTKGKVSGTTPLIFAIRHDFEIEDIGTLMVSRCGTRENINARDNSGRTALSYTVQKGDDHIVKCLLDCRARVDPDILHFLPETAAETTLAIVGLLIQAGASLDARDESGKTPLIAICAKTMFFGEKDYQLVRSYFTRDIEPTAKDNFGQTALSWAVRPRYMACSPFTATAAGIWQQAIIKLLLDAPGGLSILNEGDLNGRTPLMHAVDAGTVALYDPLERGVECQREIVSLLLDRGASVDVQDTKGRTALWLVVLAETPRLAVAMLLMDRGADPRVLDVNGRALLSEAVEKHGGNTVPVVKLLLEYDASRSSLKNCLIRTAFDSSGENKNRKGAVV